MRVSTLIADDYAVVRRGLRALLEEQPDWQVVGEASNGRDAANLAAQLRPDVVIMDIRMPELNGLDAARMILRTVPNTRIVFFTGHQTDEMIERALQVGVRGYVLKSDAEADLISAVRALMQGRTFFTPRASTVVVDRLREKEEPAQPALTTREAEVVQLLAEGKSNKEAAHILGISSRTVENHRAQIMQRLNVRSYSDLIRYAIRNGIIEP